MDLIFDGDNLFRDFENDELRQSVRRIYRMPQRHTVDNWDDIDFIRRFRVSKTTFLFVLQLVVHELEHPQTR